MDKALKQKASTLYLEISLSSLLFRNKPELHLFRGSRRDKGSMKDSRKKIILITYPGQIYYSGRL